MKGTAEETPRVHCAIGEAARRCGTSERALRYYQQIGLVTPCERTPGGMRRYSEEDLERIGRIRELQSLLGLNLEEIAKVLGMEDRIQQIRDTYKKAEPGVPRLALARESLELHEALRETVTAKREALEHFLSDLDAHIAKIADLIGEMEAGSKR